MPRDNFSKPKVEALAKRAGYRCSRPDCDKQTVGPSTESTSSVSNIGQAAHITAASPGGPRYDPTMTPNERASIDNGIWLCADHGKLVDTDAVAYPVELLRRWKSDHDLRVAAGIGRRSHNAPRDHLVSTPLQIRLRRTMCVRESGSIDDHVVYEIHNPTGYRVAIDTFTFKWTESGPWTVVAVGDGREGEPEYHRGCGLSGGAEYKVVVDLEPIAPNRTVTIGVQLRCATGATSIAGGGVLLKDPLLPTTDPQEADIVAVFPRNGVIRANPGAVVTPRTVRWRTTTGPSLVPVSAMWDEGPERDDSPDPAAAFALAALSLEWKGLIRGEERSFS